MPSVQSNRRPAATALTLSADDRLPLAVCWRIWLFGSLALWALIASVAL